MIANENDWNVNFKKDVKVEEKIGDGSFAIVFKGQYKPPNGEWEPCAIKLLKQQEISAKDEIWQEFKTEVELLKR